MRLRILLLIILGMVLGSLLTIGTVFIFAKRDFKNTDKWLCINACHQGIEKVREYAESRSLIFHPPIFLRDPTTKSQLLEKIKQTRAKRLHPSGENLDGGSIAHEGGNAGGGSTGCSEASVDDLLHINKE